MSIFERCKPVYTEMAGWKEDISNVRKFDDLPANAKRYIKRIETILETKVSIISVGPKREETIILREI